MEYMIEVNGLRKNYAGFSLKDVSFSIPGGTIMGLVGENGAGKTTVIKAILGLIHKDGGTVKVMGRDMDKAGMTVRGDIGAVLDGAGYYESLRVVDVSKFMGKIYKSWDSNYFERLLRKFSLPENKRIKEYSTGMRMKLMIASALAHRPKLLILDEATSGLDPVIRDEILDLLLEFIQDEEHSVLISSHITSDLEKITDYITYIHKGEVFLSDEKDRIMEKYGIVRCGREDIKNIEKSHIIGIKESSYSCDVLVDDREEIKIHFPQMVVDRIHLEDILLFKVKGEN